MGTAANRDAEFAGSIHKVAFLHLWEDVATATKFNENARLHLLQKRKKEQAAAVEDDGDVASWWRRKRDDCGRQSTRAALASVPVATASPPKGVFLAKNLSAHLGSQTSSRRTRELGMFVRAHLPRSI